MQIPDRKKLEQECNQRIEQLRNLKRGKHLHIIGICGTGTTQVATLLKQLGFKVTGSDKAFYPPMGDIVKSIVDKVFEGYLKENLNSKPDFIIVGNSIRADNPEVVCMLENNIPFASMPEALSAFLIGDRQECKTSVVVAGTHGKTTTSCAIAEVLTSTKKEPGFFIGGAPIALSAGIELAGKKLAPNDKVVVLEGDEYDSAFFAKWPKFHSYRPDILVITSIDFDHGDIYESIEEIQNEFFELAKRVPKDGIVLIADTDKSLKELGLSWQASQSVSANIVFYGHDKNSEFHITNRKVFSDFQEIQISDTANNNHLKFTTHLIGEHNALNLTATAAVCLTLGIDEQKVANALTNVRGVRRRQQIIANKNNIIVIEDFAHHPQEVKATLMGIKERYPSNRIVAVFEPRSNTSKRAYFQDSYASSFFSANLVLLKNVLDASGYSNTNQTIEKLNVHAIANEIKKHNIIVNVFDYTSDIITHLQSSLKDGDVIVIMSNGDFDGLPAKVASIVNE